MAHQMTEEEINQEMLEHDEICKGMEKSCEEMAQVLGRNNSVVIKMMKINEIFRSFTKQEIIDLISLEDETESESTPVQEKD